MTSILQQTWMLVCFLNTNHILLKMNILGQSTETLKCCYPSFMRALLPGLWLGENV